MNPGEQDQNPFRRPGSISGSQNSASINRSRYFGARSRYQSNHSQNTTVPNPQGFVNPFSQQQTQQLPTTPVSAAQKPKHNHKKRNIFLVFVAAATIIATIALIVVSIVVNENGLSLKGTNHSLSDLLDTFNEYDDYFHAAWEQNLSIREGNVAFPYIGEIDKEVFEKYKKKYLDYAEKLTSFSKELEKFGKIDAKYPYGDNYDINKLLSSLKSTVQKTAVFYEKYTRIIISIARIKLENASDDSIKEFKDIPGDEKLHELADKIANIYKGKADKTERQEYEKEYKDILMNISVDIGKEMDPTLIIGIINNMVAN